MTFSKPGASGLALIAVNLVPLAGVLFAGWRAADVVLMYWVENLIVGLLNIPRILLAQAEPGDAPGRALPDRLRANAPAALFFVLHYGLFCAVHWMALIELFGADTLAAPGVDDDSIAVLLAIWHRLTGESLSIVSAAALLGSHLFSFFFNFLGQGEYRCVVAGTMVERPYKRIAVVQVFAIVCGALLQHVDSPLAAVAVFVLVKTVIDLHLHGRERVVLGEGGDRGG